MTKNEENKIRCGLKWLPNDKYKHNNQQKTCWHNGEETGYGVRPAGVQGEHKLIILGQLSWGIV
jgi:hypothetical protein